MMERTDRHFRVLLRHFTRHTLLYTEMVHARAVIQGDRDRLLGFDPMEHPLALQLGGDDPKALAEAAAIGEDWGYDEINLNIGCPSPRVQEGNFGVCLMGQPDRVARAVEQMRSRVAIPVTVKHRIGFDDQDAYEDMLAFVDRVAESGCDRFTVHARKAWLSGLSPKENRTVPPLRRADVFRLKVERPLLHIEINGEIRSPVEALSLLAGVDAVMIGRAAYEDPAVLAEADPLIFGLSGPDLRPVQVAEAMADYVDRVVLDGGRASHVTRHLVGLFAGVPGARSWRRTITEGSRDPSARGALLRRAMEAVGG